MNENQQHEEPPVQLQRVERMEGLQSMAELEHSFKIAIKQRELLSNYISQQLKPNKHFYEIQKGKPSLTKEGAELICLPHGLVPDYTILSGPDAPPSDWQDVPFQITVKCTLKFKGSGSMAGSGLGSASSFNSKKRYTQGQPDGYEQQPRQADPGLCHNATLKMAQKSAYIAATLNSTAASEFFTQDLDAPNATAGESSSKPQSPRGEPSRQQGGAFKTITKPQAKRLFAIGTNDGGLSAEELNRCLGERYPYLVEGDRVNLEKMEPKDYNAACTWVQHGCQNEPEDNLPS